MRCSPVFFVLRFRRRLVHVKYMMYRAGELEEEEEEEKKGRKENWRGKDDWRRSREKGGRFKTLEDETANDFHGRIITTPFVFCPGDKSLVDSVSMREVSFPFFLFSS